VDTMGEVEGLDGEVEGDIEGDVEGLSVVGVDEIGAMMRALQRKRKQRVAVAAPALPSALRGASTQGISTPKEELDALPFTVTQPPAGPAPAGTTATAEAFPQRPFRGERLILTAVKINSTTGVVVDVSSSVVISPAWYVGAVQIGASQGELPLSTFSPTAFGVRLSLPPAGQGARIYIPFVIKIPLVAAESIVITASLIGRAVR
jgi:hypothetical protein